MALPSPELLASYWSAGELETNIIIFMNLLGALALGLLLGYERAYHGRAAGMRTYGLVCTASCALVVISGYPQFWYGGHSAFVGAPPPDPTRVIQGVVTGIGFLGAGVIMKEGFSISGLTTAASIWASSAIGIMVGVGFYGAAILLAILSAACMTLVSRLEGWLPSRPAVAITMGFRPGFVPRDDVLKRVALERGYEIAWGTLRIEQVDGHPVWHFVAVAQSKDRGVTMPALAQELSHFEGVEHFTLSHARN
ncbi:MgtC/SapB family protein [Azonexus sp. IMCC34839]|uniref:MgtC/SapB family protein n=1 Tax=Azonexus sp. IMCC34839 TaxID=3133695 RepID=UPI00399B389D